MKTDQANIEIRYMGSRCQLRTPSRVAADTVSSFWLRDAKPMIS